MLEHLLDPFEIYRIPLDDWTQTAVDWLVQNFRPAFQAIRWPVAETLNALENFLVVIPPSIFLAFLFLVAWQFAGIRTATFCALAMAFLGFIGIWEESMVTLAMIITAVAFCALMGLPLGIWCGRSDRAEAVARPILDVMQTLPAFVYLVPIVMLVGIGNVPGVIITIFFALPPIIRLTSLGIRGVPESIVEAAYAFGSSDRQVLFKIQVPLAARTIMAGLNQTLMMALAMVTIASMIAVEGLGQLVLRGIGRLDVGLAALGGIGIVLLAMILDRVTQSVGVVERGKRGWNRRGPIGLLLSLAGRRRLRAGAERSVLK